MNIPDTLHQVLSSFPKVAFETVAMLLRLLKWFPISESEMSASSCLHHCRPHPVLISPLSSYHSCRPPPVLISPLSATSCPHITPVGHILSSYHPCRPHPVLISPLSCSSVRSALLVSLVGLDRGRWGEGEGRRTKPGSTALEADTSPLAVQTLW